MEGNWGAGQQHPENKRSQGLRGVAVKLSTLPRPLVPPQPGSAMRSPAAASLREDSLGSSSAGSQDASPPWGGSLLCVLAGRLFTFSTSRLGTFEAPYLSSNLEQCFKYTGSLSPFFQLRKPSLGEVRLGQVSKSAVPTPSLGLEPPLWTGAATFLPPGIAARPSLCLHPGSPPPISTS